MASFEGELTSLVEFCAYFYLPWFQGEKACVLVAALLSLELGICHPYGMV
jgi:hypothetical protein